MNDPLPPRSFWGRNSNQIMNWGCLLIVLVFLVALLMPVSYTPRSARYRMQSSNQLKQIGLALHDYHDIYQQFPPAYVTDEDGEPLYSWRVLLLPLLEEKELYDQFDLQEPWWSDHNRALIKKMPDVYASVSHEGATEARGKTPYRAIVDKHAERTVLRPKKSRSFSEITDGASNSAMVIDDPARLVEWTKPEEIDPLELLTLTPIAENGMYGINVLLADGSVTFIGEQNRSELIGLIYCDDERLWER